VLGESNGQIESSGHSGLSSPKVDDDGRLIAAIYIDGAIQGDSFNRLEYP